MKRLGLMLALAWSGAVFGQSSLSTSINPGRSLNGEPVQFKVRVQHVGPERVDAPQMPTLTDWDVLNSFQSISPRTVMRNGAVTTQTQGEFVYVLRPKRAGTLQIPSIRLRIGSRVMESESLMVIVDKVPSLGRVRPTPPSTPTPLPGLFPDSESKETPSPGNTRIPIPDRESVFVRAVPSQYKAWVGEFIEVGYYLFQDGRSSVTNIDVAKYPDFKGFLKEDLNVPRRLQSSPFELDGKTFSRTELITYGLFPLRAGSLSVEPMRVRLETLLSPADMLNSIMMGQPPNLQNAMPMDKSSQELRFEVRPLPTAPAGVQFTNAVGQIEMDWKVTSPKLLVDQPFSVLLTIRGSGNFPLIEAPELKVPAGLESFQTKSSHELRPDGTGFKTIEYLLLPRSGGTLTLPSLEWAFFDPQTTKYRILSSGELTLNISGEAKNPVATSPGLSEKVEDSFKIFVGAQKFRPVRDARGGLSWLIFGQALVFLGLLVAHRYEKRLKAQQALFSAKPWLITEKELAALSPGDVKKRASLSDRWLRERLSGLLIGEGKPIESETPRSEVMGVLAARIPQFSKQESELRGLWDELDFIRFSGSTEKASLNSDWLSRCKSLVTAMEKTLKTQHSATRQNHLEPQEP